MLISRSHLHLSITMSKAPKTPPPPVKPLTKELAAALSITPRRVSQLRQAGMPADSIAAAEAWRKKKSASGEISADQLRAARFHLIEEQRRRCRIENDVRDGELVTVSSVMSDTLAVCQATKAAFLGLTNHLPPILEGLTAPQICRVLRENFNRVLGEMHRGQYYSNPEHREACRILIEEEKKFNTKIK
jgi:hypothetical protein